MDLHSLYIENFQSHKNTTLHFNPRFNVFIGSTHDGKTAILRALSFLLNDYWSKVFIRKGSNNVKVVGQFSDGTILEREKGKANKVKFIDSNGKSQTYEGFGSTVPKDFIKISISDNNVSHQHDPLFFITQSSFEKAKILGNLSGLNIIDSVLQALKTDISKSKMLIEDRKLKIKELEGTLEKEKEVSNIKSVYESSKKKLEELNETYKKVETIKKILSEIEDFNIKYIDFKKRLEAFEKIDIEAYKSSVSKKLLEEGLCPTCKRSFSSEKEIENCLGSHV